MSDSEEENSKTSTLPKFNGKDNGYQLWLMRFKAYAGSKTFSDALEPEFDTKLPDSESEALDSSNAEQKKKISAKKKNIKAMQALTLAFKGPSLMNMIYKSMSDEFPRIC